jgi:hypothetical protein
MCARPTAAASSKGRCSTKVISLRGAVEQALIRRHHSLWSVVDLAAAGRPDGSGSAPRYARRCCAPRRRRRRGGRRRCRGGREAQVGLARLLMGAHVISVFPSHDVPGAGRQPCQAAHGSFRDLKDRSWRGWRLAVIAQRGVLAGIRARVHCGGLVRGIDVLSDTRWPLCACSGFPRASARRWA